MLKFDRQAISEGLANSMAKMIGKIDVEPLFLAADSFFSAMKEVTTDLTRDGAIQRFEYTFELAWKTMKRILRSSGSEVQHPRDVFREAAVAGLIDEPTLWFDFLEKRNKTTHIYKRTVAEEVFSAMPTFQREIEIFLITLSKKVDSR